MNKTRNNITLINTISSLILQVCTIINGFIIQKIILICFGSEVNGLVSSLTKFLNYIVLLEGGVTGVVMASMYKPLVNHDEEKLSSIVKTTIGFYKRISYVFLAYTIILAIGYPLIFKTNLSFSYVFWLTIILSITSFLEYNFSLTMKTLLCADKKVYIVSLTKSTILIINIVISYISLKIYPSVHFLKIASAFVFLIQPCLFNLYVIKNYNLNKNAKEDKELLKSRWDGFSVNIAAYIHNNTDILFLSLFTDLKTVSVYNVYSLIGGGLKTVLDFLSNGMNPTIGQLYAKENYEELEKELDVYEYLIFFLVFLLFSVACLLICPFVMLYTKNITDTNYYQPVFGVLLMLGEGFYLIKNAHVSLAYSANKFKDLKKPCYIEAVINIVVSTILIKPLGLNGVAIGTLVAMIYRMIFQVWYTNKKLIKRPQIVFYKKLVSFGFFTFWGMLICIFAISKIENTILSWIWHGLVYILIFGGMYLINSLCFYRNELRNIVRNIKNEKG